MLVINGHLTQLVRKMASIEYCGAARGAYRMLSCAQSNVVTVTQLVYPLTLAFVAPVAHPLKISILDCRDAGRLIDIFSEPVK